MILIIVMLIVISALGAIYSGYLGIKNYKQIIITNKKVSFPQILKISIQYGLAGTFIFFALVITLGLLDESYMWSVRNIANSLIISMIAGGITILGSIYQVYTTIKFRGLLIRKLKQKKD